MAYEYTLDKIINPEEIIRIQEAEKSFNATATAYGKLAAKMAGGIKINPSDLEAMDKKQKEYIASLKELHSTQSELSNLQKEYDKLLKSVAEQTKKNVEHILAESKANDLNAAAELNLSKAKTEQLKQEKLLNQERKVRKVSVDEAISIMKQEVKTEREATEQNRLLRIAKKDVDITTEEGRKIVMQMNNVIDRNTETIRRNADSMVKQKMTIGDYKEQVKGAIISIQNGDRSMKNFGIVAQGFGGILKESVSPAVGEIKVGISSMIKGWVGAQAVLSGIQDMIGLFKSGMHSVIDFEASNSNLAAILGTTSKNIKELTDDAKRLGAETKYTASEVTNLQIELAKLGFSRKEILQSTEGILKFAQATGAELPEAAALAGASLRMFGADTKETERYVSAMAVATVKSALSFSYLQTAMPIVGPVAKAFNFQIEDTLALLGKLSDAGFDASMAATATRNILLNLADGSGKLATALGKPVDNLPDLVAGLQELRDKGVDLNATLELTDKRSVAAFNAFLTAADGIVPLRKQITGVGDDLNDMANVMADNVKGELAGLSSAWESFMITLGRNTGAIAGMVHGLTELVRWMREVAATGEELREERLSNAKRVGEEAARGDKLWVESKKKSIDQASAYEHNRGTDWSTAFEKSREQQLKVLEKSLLHEESRLQLYTKRNMKQWREYNDRNFLKQGIGLQKSTGEMNKDINESFSLIEQQTSYIASLKVKMDQIKGISNSFQAEGPNKGGFKMDLTDKEKAAQEKAAKESLKIRETYQQSELDLMDEGLEKELAKISLNYTKKMAAVKGGSAEEIKTRENLAKEMQSAINDKATSYVIAKEQKDIANKLEAVKKGSKEELDLRVEQLELQRDIEITEAAKSGEDVTLIDEKYNAKRMELDEKFANEQNKKLQDGYASRSIISNQEMEGELSALAGEYAKGIITKEKYEEEKLKIQQRYAIKQSELAVEIAKMQLGTGGLSESDEMAIKNKIAEAEMALAKLVADTNISEMEREDDARKKKLKNWEDGLAMVGDALNAFADLGSAIYERKIEEVEEEQDANQEAGDAEAERMTRLEETGAITKEEAEARKRAAEQKTAEKDKELAKKKADLQTKQAKMDKANAVAQCIIQTSLAVMSALNTPPFPLGLALAVVAGAMGAVQLATIIAQPIPKYAKGTDNHPGGLAVVGDGGREEMIISGGKSWITPSVPTLVDIPKGAMVMPDVMNMESIRGMKSDVMLLLNEAERKGNPVTVNVSNDYRKLEVGIDRLNSSFNAMAKYQRKAAVQADLRNISSRL